MADSGVGIVTREGSPSMCVEAGERWCGFAVRCGVRQDQDPSSEVVVLESVEFAALKWSSVDA